MLHGKRVELIAPKKEFIPIFCKWMNDLEVTQYLLRYTPISLEEEEKWYQNLHLREVAIFFSILASDVTPAVLIGNCDIQILWKDRIGRVGIVIGEKNYCGQVYGTEAMQSLIEYAFMSLNLHRIELEVLSNNPRAFKSYQKCGFVEEGRRRQALYRNGLYLDSIVMGLLYNDWRNRSK